jgi:peptide/nickel transport system substrate-binding protein
MRLKLLLAAAAAASLAWSTATVAQSRTEMTMGMTQYPATFHPLGESMLAKSLVNYMANRPVSGAGLDWNVTCFLCTELPTLENGRAAVFTRPDGTKGMTVRFTLQPEARWGDGRPVSSDDVVFTWEVGKHPLSGVAAADIFHRIEKIDVQDAKTFTLTYKGVSYDYNNLNNDFIILPAHIERAKFQQDPATYKDRTAYQTDSTNPGLWNGPYRLAEVSPGSHLVYTPNQHWYGRKPGFQRITVRIIGNTQALEANLLSGSIDYISAELGLTLDQALAFEKRQGAKFDYDFKPGLIYEHINLNLDVPALKDVRVRQALLYGIDRKTLVEQLFEGKQPVATSFVNPLDRAAYSDDIPKYAYDADKARKLLDEAGWSTIRDGIRYNARGDKLGFDFATTAGNRTREQVQQVIQSQWRRIGVEARIKNDPAQTFFGETTRTRKFELGMWAWTSTPESVSSAFQLLHSTQVPTEQNNWSGNNRTGFKSAAMDKLVDQVRTELDPAKRKQLWAEMQLVYMTELPVLPLYFRAEPGIIPKTIDGIKISGHSFTSTLWVEDWKPK